MLKLELASQLCANSAETVQGLAVTDWLHCTRNDLSSRQKTGLTHSTTACLSHKEPFTVYNAAAAAAKRHGPLYFYAYESILVYYPA